EPVGAALRLKALLLEGVDPLESLKGKTLTEGRLNVNTIIKGMCLEFGAPPKDLAIKVVYPNPSDGRITLEMSTSHFDAHTIKVYDSMGRIVSEAQLYPSGETFKYQLTMATGIPGYYVVQLEYKNDRVSYPFVVQ
ncbi:MAG: hypothetical protein DRI69_11020, partial [Bacteroidetes bacterium]